MELNTDSVLNPNMITLYETRNTTSELLTQPSSFPQYCAAVVQQRRAERRIDTETQTKSVTRVLSWFRRSRVACCGNSINVTVVCLNKKRMIQIDDNQTLEQICNQQRVIISESWFSFGGRPMRMSVPVREYGICEGSTIVQNARIRGGSTTPIWKVPDSTYRVYTHVVECEHQVLSETFRLQANERLTEGEAPTSELLQSAMKLIEDFKGFGGSDNTWICDLLENFFQVAYWTRRCRTKTDYITCTMLSFKLVTGKSVSSSLWNAFNTHNLQDDMFTKLTRDMRDMFTTASLVSTSPLLKKLRQVYTYLLVQGFLSHFGMDMGVEEYLKLDARVKVDYKSKTNMVMLIVDTALTICERLDAYRLTGDWHALVHDDATYTTWVKTAERIIALAPFTSNLAAHGTTYFTFVSDLSDCIEKGEAICRYSSKTSGMESVLMRKRLSSLQLLKNVEITRRASQKERKAPFGVLIHGGSSVGKSSFTKMLFYYYGRLNGLDVDDHFRYVRNPTDEYWSNFDSSKWCIQMDDIAFLLPSKSADVDATLKEMLNVVNNVPYVPPQAALEDKGKTPVMAELVLATTNAPDLNAQDYFHCPLAVRRRLPYVIHVRPKDEYLAANGKFLDPTKLPPITDKFPDYWVIEVQKLVPVDHNGRDSATFETVQIFSDVEKFLKHFAQASVAHKLTQDKSDGCDTLMKDIKVCRLCYSVGDECCCLQAAEYTTFTRLVLMYCSQMITDFASHLVLHLVCTWVYVWFARFYIVRSATARVARFLNAGVEIKIHSILNRGREIKFKLAVKTMLQAGLVLTNLFLCYKAGQSVWNATAPKGEKSPEPAAVETDDDEWEEQGNVHGTTETQLEKETTQNVWYNPTLELSKFDVPVASRSLATIDSAQIRDLFSQNCVRIEVHAMDATFATRMGAIFLRGQYLCFNRHALRLGTQFRIRICVNSSVQGLSSNIDCFIARSEVREIPSCDVVVVRIANVPPRKDILKYWNTGKVPITQMVSVRRRLDGTVSYTDLFNVTHCAQFPVESLDTSMDVYMGTGAEETKVGDCGSLGVGKTPQGPIILGIHTLGHRYTAAFPHVTRTQLEELCDEGIGAVEGGGEPALSLNGDVILAQPHHKSVLRYLQEGTANVYGHLPGHRARARSRVCPTPLTEQMQHHFGCSVDFGQPVMTGWEPIYNNVVEMVKPYTNIDQTVLDHCVSSYIEDVTGGLESKYGDVWKKELVFLSRRAAVNGLPGVKFIDKLNASTSMGHPWHSSKKGFLLEERDEAYPEGVTFTPEVWDRVSAIEAKYVRGQRAFPIFTGHLKDEATSLAKIQKKKTRVFTGAPVDWSIVVRSRLLSFVRLLQKNKLIFEAAPGTVAQSVEWTHFHAYITQHGADRIVAGDYGKFDKHMIATFVLAAFQIIGRIHKEAGFSDEEVRQIYCIGNDTAFPMTNIAGDIIEFYGTNPSGHPLTVIVNSIVNSLYMRYAYCQLNPAGKRCQTFKQDVNLLTYGDDNIMGVSPTAPWFNHTAIQSAMAHIGVEYTMADKDSVSRPYIHISECAFLKRSWRFESELQMYVCPLEEASIHKSLTMWLPSRTIDEYKQMIDVIVSANNEYFFHGKEIFDKHHAFFTEITKTHPYSLYMSETTLPSWSDLIVRFQKASEGIALSD